jgi:hypothetical protein
MNGSSLNPDDPVRNWYWIRSDDLDRYSSDWEIKLTKPDDGPDESSCGAELTSGLV